MCRRGTMVAQVLIIRRFVGTNHYSAHFFEGLEISANNRICQENFIKILIDFALK